MRKDDWYGLGASLGAHLVLILLFALITGARPQPDQIGYLQIEFGPIADGRAVQRAPENRPEVEDPAEHLQPQPEEKAAPPEVARPAELPVQRETRDERVIEETPRTETISPQQQNNPAEVRRPEAQPEQRPVQPTGGGATDGTTGASDGSQGDANDAERSSPFQIEGLNRDLMSGPLPAYAENVNAVIRVRITVDPQGRIVQRLPLLKGSPALEQAVMDALQGWRFNPLPPNAPQEPQHGIVTFRFQLE
jgi:periplasmic protein TonB